MIIHKEKHFAICQKPTGISSQKSSDGKESMIELVAKTLSVSENDVHPIHRLDNPVGGTMVYATSKEGARELGKLVSENKMQKRYLAVICGVPEEKAECFATFFLRTAAKTKAMWLNVCEKG